MITNLFSENLWFTAVFVFLLSFSVAYFALPSVIYVVKQKNLMDSPNERSSHKEKTPTLGGISFFVSIVFTLMVFRPFDIDQVGINILSGVGVLFFVGLKDDLVGVKPSTKIIGQIIATLMLFFSTDLKITTLDGFLNITDIPYWTSVFISCAIVMAIVNSYNLIDGINGSASMVGMVIFSGFAYVFYDAEMYYYFLLSILCIGFLLAFLRYNLSNKKRVFMGDTGSMIVGFILAVLAIKFFALDTTSLESAVINPANKVWVLLSIIFIPFFDTTRVFTTRIIRHGKPFKADRSHIHHVFIDYLKLSHAKASILLASINLSVFIVILCLNTYLSSLWLGVLLTSIFIILSALLFYVNRSYHSLKSKQKVRHFINGINNL
ncbi:MraY family glycosyltransferase [Capnocytophaga leadbetteri]|uniref:glycosyltransferase family 4 protein n=1 Tax=Capnocytophaga leadbetteri TaxID=327575 RepID=UPI0028E25751|nr:MraY family glycosyltransferase [Capnocytophaga leadbetteri]